VLKKESRVIASTVSSDKLRLSQHTVEKLQKSNVPSTDDSHKYSYQRTPDGYGMTSFVLCNFYVYFEYLCPVADYTVFQETFPFLIFE